MSSLWNFIGGAADVTLDRRKQRLAEEMRKAAEERALEVQLQAEQRRAEAQRDRDMMEAEEKNLERKRKEQERSEDIARETGRYEEKRKYGEKMDAAKMEQENRRLSIWQESLKPREVTEKPEKPQTPAQQLAFRNNLQRAIDSMPSGPQKIAAKAALQNGDLEDAFAIVNGQTPEVSPTAQAGAEAFGSLYKRMIGG